MGQPLKNPPVYLTLAQVRFNPILSLADFLPKIQEKFRLAKFPDFKRYQLVAIQIAMQDGQSVPTPVPVERFQFGNNARTHLFTLDNQSLTLQSTKYGHFDTFSACFLDGLKIVHEVVNFAFNERIGLRYLDRIMPRENETVEQYLVENVHGMNKQLGGKSLYSFSESLNEIGSIRLMSRVILQEGPLVPPPDIQLDNMDIEPRFLTYTGKNAVLDNDGFIEGRESFSIEKITEHLGEIHGVISEAFRTTVTPASFHIWDA